MGRAEKELKITLEFKKYINYPKMKKWCFTRKDFVKHICDSNAISQRQRSQEKLTNVMGYKCLIRNYSFHEENQQVV